MRWLILPAMLVLALPAVGAVLLSDRTDGCTVTTDRYRLEVSTARAPWVRLLSHDGRRQLAHLGGLWLEQGGRRLEAAASPLPHFHPLRAGPYLVELHLGNIVLGDATGEWPGLAELSLYCHEDRVYLLAAFLCSDKEWVNRGLYVYRAPEGHRACPAVAATACGLGIEELPAVGGAVVVSPTVPAGQAQLIRRGAAATFEAPAGDAPWQPGSAHEVGCMLAITSSPAEARDVLAEGAAPLPAEAFTMATGTCGGYDLARGVYAMTAVTSGTPTPPRGLRAGTRFTVRNDGRGRRLLIDQRDPWGGITGGILRDAQGEPLPTVLQFGLNFPELHQEAGEPGWATLTYPLTLEPNQTREVRAEHLYNALSDREAMYLTSLDNIGDPLLLQVTVGQLEAHTLTTGPYPGDFRPGNELRINDFRRIYHQLVSRSASAILPTFFGYWDAAGAYQGLMPGAVAMRETGPFLIEYTVPAATRDGAVDGTVRVWEAAQDDMTRVFTEVSLQVRRTVQLDPQHEAPLFFLRHHAFNPMAFMRFAYTQADGSIHEGELNYARQVVANGAALGPLPLGCLYRASNSLEDNIPCSDITGNSGFVLLDWQVKLGEREVHPGCFAFCTGANDDIDGAYARDVAIVPCERVTELPAGSRVHYRAVQMVWGNNASDTHEMERERERWGLRPLRVTARVGKVVSSDPPEIVAARGRAEIELSGGAGWLPVRVSGMRAGKPLRVWQTDGDGRRQLGPGGADEPWYSAWPADRGTCGFTFLVKMPAAGGTVRLEVSQ